MSFDFELKNILGFWENDNFPPYAFNDNLEIYLNLKDEFETSLITLKKGDSYTNYAIKFIQLNTNGIDKIQIIYQIFNGDNIDISMIGKEIILECSMFLGNPKADTMVCENELTGKRIFKRKP